MRHFLHIADYSPEELQHLLDLATSLKQEWQSPSGNKPRLKGPKAAQAGGGTNVATSLLHLCAKLGANFSIASPAGYDLSEETLDLGHKFAAASGSSLNLFREPRAAVHEADVIYTDTWTSM